MKIKLAGIWHGELAFSVDGISGTPEVRVMASGVNDGVEHLQYCLEMLGADGLVKEGDFLISLGSENTPDQPLSDSGYDWGGVPSTITIFATKKSGERVETARPSSYY